MKKIAMIKFGGHAFIENKSINILVNNIKYLRSINYSIVIVHGGTPSVNDRLNKENIKSDFIDGFRVTTEEIVNIVQEEMLGKHVISIVKLLNNNDLPAVGVNGTDNNLIRCSKYLSTNNVDYGYVGNIEHINTNLLNTLMEKDYIPVISPIGVDDYGQSYNLNTDILAQTIATYLHADAFFMVTNVNGIYKDINDPSTRIKKISEKEINSLIKQNIIGSTMKTKVLSCLNFTNNTNIASYIIDSNTLINHDLFSTNKYGTKILKDECSKINFRLATYEDINDILKILKKSFLDYQKYIEYKASPLFETYEDLLLDIYNKWVFVGTINNKIICSARLKINNIHGRMSRACVHPDYYNKGYGSLMFNYIENYAKNKGVCYIGLTTIENADYLVRFYEKNNYKKLFITYNRGYNKAIMMKQLQNTNNFNIDNYLE